MPDQVDVAREPRVRLDRRQAEKDRDNDPWPPTERPGGVLTRAHVPGETSEDSPEVVDLRLDLDHEQCAVRRPVRKHIDPPAEPTLTDLDLGPHPPAAFGELSRHVATTSSVDEIALLASAGESDRVRVDRQPNSEQVESGAGKLCVDRWAARLEAADRRLIGSETPRQFALAPPEALGRRSDRPPKGGADIRLGRWLRSHEAMDTSRLFTATSLGSGAVGDRIVARLRIAIGR
ncbi:MAG: hypothetical protein QOI00_1489 [Chloroflexota bacterium]|nr:hypothetical protein [Chloroflexota bacterium]